MLLQRRSDELWLIRQHDHGWLSGAMAHLWRGTGTTPTALSHELCLATTLHDLPWQTFDDTPQLDPSTGLPIDFLHLPLPRRLPLYSKGIDDLEQIHPHVALLVSMHYAGFKGLRETELFQRDEQQRQARLRQQLGFIDDETDAEGTDKDGTYGAMLLRQLRYVQLFDLLSLYICLTAPGVATEQRPPWLLPDDVARSFDGDEFALSWLDDATVRCAPMPLTDELAFSLPVKRLPGTEYPDQPSLLTAWAETDTTFWDVRVVG